MQVESHECFTILWCIYSIFPLCIYTYGVGCTESTSNNDLELTCYKFSITTLILFPLKARFIFISQTILKITIPPINCPGSITYFVGVRTSLHECIRRKALGAPFPLLSLCTNTGVGSRGDRQELRVSA